VGNDALRVLTTVSVHALALSALSMQLRGSQLSLLHTKYSLFSVEHWRPIILDDAHSCSDVIDDDGDADDDGADGGADDDGIIIIGLCP